MRAVAVLCVLSILGGAIAAVAVRGAGAAGGSAATGSIGDPLIARIDHYRNDTWRWQRLMHAPLTHADASARRSPDPAYRRWVLDLWKRRSSRAQHAAARWLDDRIRQYRQTVLHWQRVMGVQAAPARSLSSAAAATLATREAAYVAWRRRAQDVLRRAQHPPYAAAFACIHRFEGAWTDAGGPYYGGLQMDLGFQARYGRYLLRAKGTADHWTPLEQIWVAARAARSGRGFYPWPNSARVCGLI